MAKHGIEIPGSSIGVAVRIHSRSARRVATVTRIRRTAARITSPSAAAASVVSTMPTASCSLRGSNSTNEAMP